MTPVDPTSETIRAALHDLLKSCGQAIRQANAEAAAAQAEVDRLTEALRDVARHHQIQSTVYGGDRDYHINRRNIILAVLKEKPTND